MSRARAGLSQDGSARIFRHAGNNNSIRRCSSRRSSLRAGNFQLLRKLIPGPLAPCRSSGSLSSHQPPGRRRARLLRDGSLFPAREKLVNVSVALANRQARTYSCCHDATIWPSIVSRWVAYHKPLWVYMLVASQALFTIYFQLGCTTLSESKHHIRHRSLMR